MLRERGPGYEASQHVEKLLDLRIPSMYRHEVCVQSMSGTGDNAISMLRTPNGRAKTIKIWL